ncbi:MAG: DNA methyltransferase [Deltaproteobacteria bacterium RBG_13_47_9]|nr:MAG: DNA methyltransferase [Deltaproteobacteria bacterium RBG_13_47_9]
MPTLDWIGKKAVVNHHNEVPFHLLKEVPDLSVGEPGSGNLLVEGDNLVALKALLPYYAGQIKCIYIDPPYNTGDENWIYNDNVNSPEIRKWLGQTVGKESEDLSRHDKWLCMMYPRLALLHQFLRGDGVIFVSIDENEAGYLRLLMDEIFGLTNCLGTLVWKRRSSSAMRGTPLSIDHEYVLVFARDSKQVSLYGLQKGVEGYPYKDDRGYYASTDLTVGMGKDVRPGQFYPLINPKTGRVYQPNPERVWRFFPDTMKKIIESDLIIWPDDSDGKMQRPRYKTYFDPNSAKPKPVSSWIETVSTNEREIENQQAEYDVSILTSGMNQEGGKLLQTILGTKMFAYPKPLSLVRSLIRASTRNDDILLDSFAGTGTTGHAVLLLNKEDGNNRRFILVEMDPKICSNVTAERLKRVSNGYEKPNGKIVEGLGGGFRFSKLGTACFDEHGRVNIDITFADIARHIFFTETGEPLSSQIKMNGPLIGIYKGTAIYLLYNGVLKDKRANGGNVLTHTVIDALPKHDGPKVIYGTACRLSPSRLKRENIIFKQIPYEIKVR